MKEEWELQGEPLQITSNYMVNAHTALPRPPSGTVCGVDIGNGGDLADEGMEATGREMNGNSLHICERSMHIINQVMLNEHLH